MKKHEACTASLQHYTGSLRYRQNWLFKYMLSCL
jgi:hypothetical protein